MNVKHSEQDKPRKRCLLLHYLGTEEFEIYKTLDDETATYDPAKPALTEYFTPKHNKDYERDVFRNTSQIDGEDIRQFCIRFKKLSVNADFANTDDEIKAQIIQGCKSSDLRKRALTEETGIFKKKLIETAKSSELADRYSADMNGNLPANRVSSTK